MNKNPNKSDNQKAFEQMLMGKMCFVNVKFDHLKWTTAVTAAFYWRSTGFFFFLSCGSPWDFHFTEMTKKKTCPTGDLWESTGMANGFKWMRIKKWGFTVSDPGRSERWNSDIKSTLNEHADSESLKSFLKNCKKENYQEVWCFMLMVTTHNHYHQQKGIPAIMLNGLYLFSAFWCLTLA